MFLQIFQSFAKIYSSEAHVHIIHYDNAITQDSRQVYQPITVFLQKIAKYKISMEIIKLKNSGKV